MSKRIKREVVINIEEKSKKVIGKGEKKVSECMIEKG
jgi:hypothetical protein